MTTLYILQNQHGYYLKKNSPEAEWVDGQDLGAIFRTIHKDEAVNMLFETNSQNVELRISIKEYEANAKKHPLIPADELPPPLPKETSSDSSECSQNNNTNPATVATTDHTASANA